MKLEVGNTYNHPGLDMNCNPTVEKVKLIRILPDDEKSTYLTYDMKEEIFKAIEKWLDEPIERGRI